MSRVFAIIAAAMAFGILLMPAAGQARVFVGVGIGVPLWYPPPYYYAPPVVYREPIVVQSQPTSYISQSPSWYYCDNPRGYYPYVQNCSTAWQPVPANPPPGPTR